nr:hypothetical protein [Tanacetum cinerariifolium]
MLCVVHACELVIEWFGTEKNVAKGQVYPGRGGILHGLPIEPGFVKVQVDSVEEGCSAFPVARPTDEVKTLHDALDGQFIQWPRKYIRLHDSNRALRKDELDGWIINAGSKFFQDFIAMAIRRVDDFYQIVCRLKVLVACVRSLSSIK